MRVAIYCRVSTKDKGQDTDNQLLPLRKFSSEQQGWSVVREYIEHESASGRARRAQFSSMMQDAENGKFDLLLFWSLDRFSREGATATLQHLTKLSKAGVGWRSLQEPYLDTTSLGPFREAVIGIIAAIAKVETDRRSERVKAGIERRRAAGQTVGSKKIPIDADQLTALWTEGFSLVRLARHFGVSRPTIKARLQEMGLLEEKDVAATREQE